MKLQVIEVNDGVMRPEFWAKRCTDRIVSVSETAHPEIRFQAEVFRREVESMVLHYIRTAIQERRDRDALLAERAGANEIAAAIRND